MAMAKQVLCFTLMMALFGVSLAAVYNVGDAAGWNAGGVNYSQWASKYQFHVGDTLVFKYNNQFHNVKQVTQQAFQSCNPSAPLASYTSGSDSIVLKNPGHNYFLCGFPGHCQMGQKVDILVA